MPSVSTTVIEYGVLYPNGSQDWKTATWFGSIDEPRHRESFNEQYRLRMESMGAPGMSVRFLRREVTTIVSDTVEVFNNVEEVVDVDPAPAEPDTTDPEPPVVEETLPAAPEEPVEETLPATPEGSVEETLPAAPEEPATPPTTEAPAEEELPEDADDQEIVDPEPSVPDNEGEPTDGTVK